MIGKINNLWKADSENFDDTPTPDTAGNSMAHMNLASTNRIEKEELLSKGIKSPSKLLYSEYLSRASLEELNKNPSSPKCVHFINSIVILSKESEAKEKGSVEPNEAECYNHKRTVEAKEEVKEESEKELEEETEEETEEEEEDDPEYFDTFPIMK
ncbi:hypothetical protein Tco_0519166, partial [Tanacetum coccineum]